MTKLIERSRKPCPRLGGVTGNTLTPGSEPTCGSSSRASSIVVRLRSVQSTVRITAEAVETWPPPTNMKRRSNSGYCAAMASMASR